MNSNMPNESHQNTTVLWFRRDFRLSNNPALNFAAAKGGLVLAIYIEDDTQNKPWRPGSVSRWWCHHSLLELAERLASLGLRLKYFRGNPAVLVPQIIRESGAGAISWNRLYEPDELKLEKSVERQLSGIEIAKFDSHLLFTPGTILNKQAQPYRVFTPFWKNARVQLEFGVINPVTKSFKKKLLTYSQKLGEECELKDLALLDDIHWHTKLNRYWVPGENSALKIMKQFLKSKLNNYEIGRDIPSLDGTSSLSPYLHFGEITPVQIVYSIMNKDWPGSSLPSVERFLTQLGWHEFSHHILWHFPTTTDEPMNERFKKMWPNKPDKKRLKAWQAGNTGVPIVDAGMRQLWETGWMHNRVRMIVASFLTKNLGIHWLHGAKWFWNTLVDADLANNSLGWQWVAGCGVDAAPYYRIFNPYTQGKRFDTQLKYINKWAPESIGTEVVPIVEIEKSRVEALLNYKKIMGLMER